VDRIVNHERLTEWAVLYAMGGLEGEERAQLEAHLATGCPACTTELSDLSEVVAALAWAAPAVSPRPALRERLLAQVRTEQAPQGPAPRFRLTHPSLWEWWPRALWAGRVVVAGLVAILGWALYDAQVQLGQQRVVTQQLTAALAQERVLTTLIAHTDTHIAALASPQPTTPPAAGWIVWSPAKQRGFLVVHLLPALPAGQTYHVWVIAGQQALSATVFQVDAVGHAALLVPVAVAHPDRFEITVEPAGGVAVPSGPVMLHGSPPNGPSGPHGR
jgi:Anti-sigma-K factor rskA